MPDAGYSQTTIQQMLDTLTPGAAKAQLGTFLFTLVNAHNDLVTKYNALLAHLDTANVGGIGNANSATYGTTADTVPLPGTFSTPF